MNDTFSRVELDHILTLLRDASQDGSYYGPRAQYWKRHQRIWDKFVAQWESQTGKPYPLKSRKLRYNRSNFEQTEAPRP